MRRTGKVNLVDNLRGGGEQVLCVVTHPKKLKYLSVLTQHLANDSYFKLCLSTIKLRNKNIVIATLSCNLM